MRVLILANGEPPSPELARQMAAEHTLLLATDGAAHAAAALGLTPDVICGDFDSIDLSAAEAAFPGSTFVPTPDQHQADLEKAIDLACAQGATEITVLGATGGRIDHLLANYALLARAPANGWLCFRDDRGSVRAISGTDATPGTLSLRATPGDTISLIAYEPTVRATIEGVRWPLDRAPLLPGTRGVSNIALQQEVRIEARGGVLLVCHLYRLTTG